MDGWGHRAEPENNAVALAKTPVSGGLEIIVAAEGMTLTLQ